MKRVTLTLVIDITNESVLINEAAQRMDHAYGSGEGMGRFVRARTEDLVYESLIACNRDDRSPEEMGMRIAGTARSIEEIER